MRWLNRFLTRTEPPEHALAEQVAGLKVELTRLAASNAEMRLEWAEILAKITSWAARQAALARKRAHRALESTEGAEASESPAEPPSAPAAVGLPALPPYDPGYKSALRRYAAQQRGLTLHQENTG